MTKSVEVWLVLIKAWHHNRQKKKDETKLKTISLAMYIFQSLQQTEKVDQLTRQTSSLPNEIVAVLENHLIIELHVNYLNLLSANPTKCYNTLKQFKLKRIVWVCLTIFWGLEFKWLTAMTECIFFYPCNFVIKKTRLQVLFCEFCKISKNTFFIDYHQKPASRSS